MSDLIDQGNEAADLFHQAALSKKKAVPATRGHTGLCLNCDEPVAPPRRWCDAECMSDWQFREAMKDVFDED